MEEKKLKKMSEDTGISVVFIKEKLGIKVEGECPAETIEEAKKAYDRAPRDSDSQFLAYQKWSQLFLKKIETATSFAEIRKARSCAPQGAEIDFAILKKSAELATTISEIKEVFTFTSENSKIEEIALKKWVQIATTIKELKEVFKSSPEESEAQVLALSKIAIFYGYNKPK